MARTACVKPKKETKSATKVSIAKPKTLKSKGQAKVKKTYRKKRGRKRGYSRKRQNALKAEAGAGAETGTNEPETKPKKRKPKATKKVKGRKILEDVSKVLEHQRKMDYVNKVFDTVNDTKFPRSPAAPKKETKPDPTVPLLGCKHVTLEKLSEYYNSWFKRDMDAIITGNSDNERHRKFYDGGAGAAATTGAPGQQADAEGLWYNTSTCAFSQAQINHISNMFHASYDPEGNIYKYSRYYFQVLIPEFCLLVFMVVHGMDRATAARYLEVRPLEGENGEDG